LPVGLKALFFCAKSQYTLIFQTRSKESPLQLETINLLGKIKEGHSVTEKELTSVFTNLGLTLPDTLISSMSSKKWRYASTGNRITQLDRFCGRVRTSWID